MSEYQYLEFAAVDRPLDADEIRQLRSLSARARITPTSFVDSYNWGEFRGHPTRLVESHFDGFPYLTNCSRRTVMLRLPRGTLDLSIAQKYSVDNIATAWTTARHVILAFDSEEAGGDDADDGSGWLSAIMPVPDELARGDLRTLYLGWLLGVQLGCLDDDVREPPVPAGLGELSGSLRTFVDFFEIDRWLIAAGAARSASLEEATVSERDLQRWLEELDPAENDRLLLRALRGEGAAVGAELARRVHAAREDRSERPSTRRTVREIRDVAAARHEAPERRDVEARTAARACQQRAAAIARDEYLACLSTRVEDAWKDVDRRIETRQPGRYEEAVRLLCDLRALANRSDSRAGFEARLDMLRAPHARKPALLQRLKQAGLG